MRHTRMVALIGIALGLVLCSWFLWHMDWPAAIQALKQVQTLPVLGCALCTGLSSLTRAWRWRLLALANSPKTVPLFRFWNAACAGYLANMLFPAKAGEILRMVYLNRVTNLNAGQIMASALTDRLTDVFGIAIIACVLLSGSGQNPLAIDIWIVLPGMLLVPTAILICLIYRQRWIETLGAYFVKYFPAVIRERTLCLLQQGLCALTPLRQTHVLGMVLGATFAAFTLDALSCWLLVRAFDWPLPFMVGLWLELAFAVGGSLPAAPGYIGIYQAAAALTLGLYGLSESLAVAYAFAIQAIILIVFTLLGGYALYSLKKGHPLKSNKNCVIH